MSLCQKDMIWSRQLGTHCPRHREQVKHCLDWAETVRNRKRGGGMMFPCITCLVSETGF